MRSFQIAAVLAAVASVQGFELGKTIESIHKGFDSIVERAAPQFGGQQGGSGSPSASAPVPSGSAPASGAPSTGNTACPAIWSTISKDLVGQFLSDGQCNDLARAAIRIAFHDCATWNTSLGTSAGCDGSLYLAGEYTRPENAGLEDTIPQLGKMAQGYGVGVADFFQFAGGTVSSLLPNTSLILTFLPAAAIKICPLGPTVQTFVGRTDRSTPNPEGLLPGATEDGNSILALFEAKGVNAAELAALVGAHSTARQFVTDPAEAGAALDTTPGIWDVAYYGQTVDGTAPFTLQSDKNLANQAEVGPVFHSFINNQIGWAVAFAPAMTKMSLFGVETSGLIDCTSVLPAGTLPKRSVARGAMF